MRLLITLDGSEFAEHAVAGMAPWVRQWKAETWLMTVIDPGDVQSTLAGDQHRAKLAAGIDTGLATRGLPIEPPVALAEDRGQALESVRITTEEALEQVARTYLPDEAVHVKAAFAESASEAIAAFAAENAIDFIAMSTHGRTGLSQALIGSVATQAARQAGVPVILVGEGVPVVVRQR